MTLTKTIRFDDDVLNVLRGMTWSKRGTNTAGVIVGQLDRQLYVKVNKALAAMGGKWHRGAKAHLFPTDPRNRVAGLLDSGALTVERDGYFVTPHNIGVQMAQMAELTPGIGVLEPSAGTGELAEAILEVEPHVLLDCIEKNIERVKILRSKGLRGVVADFLAQHYDYHRIIQNPPFEELQDIDHVLHAYDCLCPYGILVSMMNESPFFRDGRKAQAFRQWLETVWHQIVNLDASAFKSSGTGVKTRIVKICKGHP